jgi:hypothetical protein
MLQLELIKNQSTEKTIPISEFFIKHKFEQNHKKLNKRVEELIDNYSLNLLNYNIDDNNDNDEYLLLKDDFEDMISDIRSIYISSNYKALFSWLIDRCFLITNQVKSNKENIIKLNKNRSLLLKTLYAVNPKMFLECFKSA